MKKCDSFYAHQDRPTYLRYRQLARRHPWLEQRLRELVEGRPDFDACQHITHCVSADSYLEILHLLYLLALGAIPCHMAPYKLARTPHPIVEPVTGIDVGLRRHPCLFLRHTFHFFQVSFQLSQVRRVDVLRWNDGWSALELNGAGHDPIGDVALRYELSDIPVEWVTAGTLEERAMQLVKFATSVPLEIRRDAC